jgi:membrane protein DedA with SNARE-associated domain
VFEAVVTWLTDTIFQLGYPGITLLMAIESSFFPFPSEVVLPPAGYLAAQGRMNVWLALGAGLGGSLIGALVNYYLAVFLGRPLLHKYHRYFLMRESSLDRAEQFFRRHGEISTFVGRLIPVIRQLISLPAGVARMRLDRFALYTALGAGIWCAILTFIGWEVGRHAEVVPGLGALIGDPDVQRYTSIAALALLPLIVVVVSVYMYRQRKRGGAARNGAGEPS